MPSARFANALSGNHQPLVDNTSNTFVMVIPSEDQIVIESNSPSSSRESRNSGETFYNIEDIDVPTSTDCQLYDPIPRNSHPIDDIENVTSITCQLNHPSLQMDSHPTDYIGDLTSTDCLLYHSSPQMIVDAIAFQLSKKRLKDVEISGKSYTISSLWTEFVSSINKAITLGGIFPNNPVVTFLASTAPTSPPLFSAVIYLSCSIRSSLRLRNGNGNVGQGPESTMLGQEMEQHALQYIDVASTRLLQDKSQSKKGRLLLLSILVTLCSAYIAQGNRDKLMLSLEHALALVHGEFLSSSADNGVVLYLVEWLGYIHTTSLVCDKNYHISAPDYLSLASELFATSQPDILMTSLSQSQRVPAMAIFDDSVFFRDVEPFTGISMATSAIFYRLGRLIRTRAVALQSADSNPLLWQDFESDIEQLEICLYQRKHKLGSHRLLYRPASHSECYNEALLHTAHLIFLCRIRDKPKSSVEVVEAAELVLDSCAAVPEGSMTSKLMVFPLYMGGLQTTRLIHQEFVRNRLLNIEKDYCTTDVGKALVSLDEEWRGVNAHETGGRLRPKFPIRLAQKYQLIRCRCFLPVNMCLVLSPIYRILYKTTPKAASSRSRINERRSVNFQSLAIVPIAPENSSTIKYFMKYQHFDYRKRLSPTSL
jgi:Fungal specific transcription factor domain